MFGVRQETICVWGLLTPLYKQYGRAYGLRWVTFGFYCLLCLFFSSGTTLATYAQVRRKRPFDLHVICLKNIPRVRVL